MLCRERKIRSYRREQPIDELKRKADKSVGHHNLWTQEELDYAYAKGKQLADYFDTADRRDAIMQSVLLSDNSL